MLNLLIVDMINLWLPSVHMLMSTSLDGLLKYQYSVCTSILPPPHHSVSICVSTTFNDIGRSALP